MEQEWCWRNLSGRPKLLVGDILRHEASLEGFKFIDRLFSDWVDESNRFLDPGELILGMFLPGGETVAVGGLSRDYAYGRGVGRLRHLYVRREWRGRGVASELLNMLESYGRSDFHSIRLWTDTEEAARFYTRKGYKAVQSDTATHVLQLSDRNWPTDTGSLIRECRDERELELDRFV